MAGVLTGIFIACAGKYLADKYTDKRRSREKARVIDTEFRSVAERMPELIAEMKADLEEHPLCREFVLLSKKWCYNSDPNEVVLSYYFEEHENLIEKVGLLENLGFVEDIAINYVRRYVMSERFAGLVAGAARAAKGRPTL